MPPVLLHVFPTLAVGGQQTRFAVVANQLGRAFRHRLISLDGQDAATALLDPDLDCAVLPAPASSANPIERFGGIVKASAWVGADILVTYNWGAIEWAIVNRLRFRRPHLHLEDGFGPDEADHQKRRRVLARRVTLPKSMVVVPSRNLAQIARTHWRLAPKRVVYIPNGIDPLRFDGIPTSGAPFFERRAGECVIGSFSPLRREKNLGRLLEAFVKVAAASSASVRLVICGDGPERPALTDLAHRLGVADRTTFTGHVPKPEAVMGAFDLFAMTSDTEQMPYAVVEAMAARLPVVATAVGDIATMVAEENRPFIVARDDRPSLVAALSRLSGDRALRGRLGQANRARVEANFCIRPMAEAFGDILTALADRATPANPRFDRNSGGNDLGVSRRSLLLMAGSGVAAGWPTPGRAAPRVSQAAALYQDHPKDGLSCGACALFRSPASCVVVAGTISPKGWCRFFDLPD
jgi:glycosyltransferase involved in cell wall biosynthesis